MYIAHIICSHWCYWYLTFFSFFHFFICAVWLQYTQGKFSFSFWTTDHVILPTIGWNCYLNLKSNAKLILTLPRQGVFLFLKRMSFTISRGYLKVFTKCDNSLEKQFGGLLWDYFSLYRYELRVKVGFYLVTG